MIKKAFLTCLFLSAFSIILAGCTDTAPPDEAEAENEKLTVAVSIIPQKTFVEAVAGDSVNVVTMIPPGYSPANYAPSPRELQSLSEAALYFSIGVPAETANILPKLDSINPEIKIVDLAFHVGQVYPHRYFDEAEHSHAEEAGHSHTEETGHSHTHTGQDPHIWLSPKRVQVMIDVIAEELSALDPAHKDVYRQNARNYKNELAELEQKIRELLTAVKTKTFFIYHPVLGYFADDFGLEMVAIEQDGKEATIEHLQEIIDLAKEKNIKVIFYQEEIYSKQAELIAGEIGATTVKIAPLAVNYLENLEKIAEELSNSLNF